MLDPRENGRYPHELDMEEWNEVEFTWMSPTAFSVGDQLLVVHPHTCGGDPAVMVALYGPGKDPRRALYALPGPASVHGPLGHNYWQS